MDTMFDIPTTSDIDSVVINEDVVVSNAPPLLVHSSVAKQDSGA
jgi:ATP-dependent protease Clp ATPase subunit